MASRRMILGAVAAGGVSAVVGGCAARPGRARDPTATSTVAAPSSSAGRWDRLRDRMGERLVRPDDPGYAVASRSYNPLYDDRRPAAVARCSGTGDVQACLALARSAGLTVAARSGGHSYAGYSTPGSGLVIDLGAMSSVRVDGNGTAVIGAGARLIDVYAGLATAGRALPGGSCPTVGIAGLTLGGGIGPLARRDGLTCDRLVSAEVVTADGVTHTVSDTEQPDLYWALRGGGGGNFGVVTSFTFTTVPAPDLTVFVVHFPADVAADALGTWQQWVPAAPNELWSNCVLTPGASLDCRIGGYLAGTESAMHRLLTDLYRRIGALPSTSFVRQMGFLDAMRYAAGCGNLPVSACRLPTDGGRLGRESFVASSRIVPTALADPARIVALVSPGGPSLLFDGLGGAVARVSADATAFAHRTALACVQIYLDTSVAGRAHASRAVATVRDELGAILGAHGYVNYIDAGMPDWATAYYGANLTRLRAVARRYDPQAVFHFAQGLSG